MKYKIRMIGTDLDGTLLTQKKEILPYTKETLIKAAESGVHVVVASGRPITGIPQEIKDLPGVRYALTANGARIVDMKTGEVLHEDLLPQEKAEEILKLFQEYDTIQEVYKNGQGYINADQMEQLFVYHPNPYMASYVKATRKGIDDVWKIVEQCPDGMDKVQAIFKNPEERVEARRRIEKLEGVKPVTSVENNIEVNKAGVDKGSGLLLMAEMLGIQREEIMTFGDSDNDIEMLQMAGIGVAVQNAIPEVLKAADYITQSNEEEGVAKAIERFVFGEQ